MAEERSKLEGLRALPAVWRSEKRERIVTVEQVRAYRARTGSAEEKAICDVAERCFAGVTKAMIADGGVAIQQQVDRAYVRAKNHEMVDICELISNPHTGKGMLQLANVATRAKPSVTRSVTKAASVTGSVTPSVTRTCVVCGKPLTGKKRGTCSPKCRKAVSRAKAKRTGK